MDISPTVRSGYQRKMLHQMIGGTSMHFLVLLPQSPTPFGGLGQWAIMFRYAQASQHVRIPRPGLLVFAPHMVME